MREILLLTADSLHASAAEESAEQDVPLRPGPVTIPPDR
jgi:hypothetical protein